MSDIQDLTKLVLKFRNDRNWKGRHKYKNMAISIVLEAAEFAEHFQWLNEKEIQEYLKNPEHKEAVADELADVLYWVLLASHDLGLDIRKDFVRKMKKNEKKYPLEERKSP